MEKVNVTYNGEVIELITDLSEEEKDDEVLFSLAKSDELEDTLDLTNIIDSNRRDNYDSDREN